jgi:hypothetical protein
LYRYLGLAKLPFFLNDTPEVFFRGDLYLVRNYVDRLGRVLRLGLLGPIDRGGLQSLIVPLAGFYDPLSSLGRQPSLYLPSRRVHT